MSPLPLLNLPFLALESVLKQFSILELIDFSQLSQKSKKIVKLLQISYSSVEIVNESTQSYIKLIKKTGESNSLHVLFNTLMLKPKMKLAKHREYHGVSMLVVEDSWIFCKTKLEETELAMSAFLKIFRDIFAFNFPIDTLKVQIPLTVREKHEKSYYKEVNFLDWNPNGLDSNIKFTCVLKSCDLMKMVFDWLQSNNTCLKLVKGCPEVSKIEDVDFGSLEMKPWDRMRRAKYCPMPLDNMDCGKGLDIERSDGLLGTVLIKDSCFYFIVWHNRFPFEHAPKYYQ